MNEKVLSGLVEKYLEEKDMDPFNKALQLLGEAIEMARELPMESNGDGAVVKFTYYCTLCWIGFSSDDKADAERMCREHWDAHHPNEKPGIMN